MTADRAAKRRARLQPRHQPGARTADFRRPSQRANLAVVDRISGLRSAGAPLLPRV